MAGNELFDATHIALGVPVRVERDLDSPFFGQTPDDHPGFVDTDGQRLGGEQDVEPECVFAGELGHLEIWNRKGAKDRGVSLRLGGCSWRLWD